MPCVNKSLIRIGKAAPNQYVFLPLSGQSVPICWGTVDIDIEAEGEMGHYESKRGLFGQCTYFLGVPPEAAEQPLGHIEEDVRPVVRVVDN